MTWGQSDAAQARDEGWRLAAVVDNGRAHPYLMVASLSSIDDRSMLAHVVNQAKAGSTLHRRALQELALSRLQPKGNR